MKKMHEFIKPKVLKGKGGGGGSGVNISVFSFSRENHFFKNRLRMCYNVEKRKNYPQKNMEKSTFFLTPSPPSVSIERKDFAFPFLQ